MIVVSNSAIGLEKENCRSCSFSRNRSKAAVAGFGMVHEGIISLIRGIVKKVLVAL